MGAKIRRALISVFDKTGVADFARHLHEDFGIEIVSTGGTARTLSAAGIPVKPVEQLSGAGEMLDGRVKTLHPAVFAAILADRDKPAHMQQLAAAGIESIDLVVVNLYPFECTIAEPGCTFARAIEMIDIGGVALLRAAAKNHRHIVVVPRADLYDGVLADLEHGDVSPDRRRALAREAFRTCAAYDTAIGRYLSDNDSPLPDDLLLNLHRAHSMRYGENPHQKGALYAPEPASNPHHPTAFGAMLDQPSARVELSYNNLVDASAARALCRELGQELSVDSIAACCFIKHTNACGVGVAASQQVSPEAVRAARSEAYRRAYLGDPNAAMGGILAVNFPVDATFAQQVMETYVQLGRPLRKSGHPAAPGGFFVEVWIAPGFDDDAVDIIRGRSPGGPQKAWGERVRLIAAPPGANPSDPGLPAELRTIPGGVLAQTPDHVGLAEQDWRVVTARRPSERELADLRLAWLVCKHTKSNAISLCRDGMLIGNGAGQMSRVMSCRVATWLAKENGHAERLAGAAAASDAFFPFPDGVELLADAGVTAIIQPGGAKRDNEVIDTCDAANLAMIFTAQRHFRH